VDVPPIVGESQPIKTAVELLDRYAPTPLSVLIVGPTGTGKDLFAEHVHWRSGRPGRLVALNCAALPRDTAESLLFGHRKGAFTGAIESHAGYFRLAHGSALFLDELLSLPPDCQAKLLRAVETGEIWPLGEREPVRVDVRVVAAVQGDVAERLHDGSFRRDLYERLAGVVIYLPPLAQRPEDVIPLARHFAAQYGNRIEPSADRVLLAYQWPGNVRELRQVIDRARPLSDTGVLRASMLATAIELGGRTRVLSDPLKHSSYHQSVTEERERLVAMMEDVGWDTMLAADRLGVHRATVYRRLVRLGLRPAHRAFAPIRANGCEFARIETRDLADDNV
jgi:transcriptional regulator with GAF, ATPase, and Fis domain